GWTRAGRRAPPDGGRRGRARTRRTRAGEPRARRSPPRRPRSPPSVRTSRHRSLAGRYRGARPGAAERALPALDSTRRPIPVVARSRDVVLVAEREREVLERAAGRFHVVPDHPGLDEAAVTVDLDVLVPAEVHRGLVREQTVLEAVEIVVERPLLHRPHDHA